MTRFGTAALAAVVGLCVAQGARADTIFQFVTTSSVSTATGQPGIPLTATFDLSDDSPTGSFFITRPASNPDAFTASSSVRSAIVQGVNLLGMSTSTNPIGFGSVNLSYANGVVTNSSIQFFGNSDDVQLVGAGPNASGTLRSDNNACAGTCTVSGFFTVSSAATQVPEPMSAVLLGAAVMGLAVTRRIRHG